MGTERRRLVQQRTGTPWAFLETLPTTTPVPDVVPEPDGEIAFEWDYGPWRILSVSVGPTGLLSYAALYGRTSKAHGTEKFIDRLPGAIAVLSGSSNGGCAMETLEPIPALTDEDPLARFILFRPPLRGNEEPRQA